MQFVRDDESAVLDLSRSHFPSYAPELLSARLNWLFEDPFGCYAWIGKTNGRVVGFLAYVSVPLLAMSRTVRAALGVDLMVAPEFRRRGMATALIAEGRAWLMKSGVSVGLGFTNSSSTRLAVGVGARHVGQLARYYIPVTPRARFLSQISRLIVRPRPEPYQLLNRPSTDEIEFGELPMKDFGELSTIRNGMGSVKIDRNRDYLLWLFSRQPKVSPRFVLAKQNGKAVGYAAYAVTHRRPFLRIGELLDVTAENPVIAHRLLSYLIRETERVDFWMTNALRGSQLTDVLRKVGFSWSLPNGDFVARIWTPHPDDASLMEASNWHLTQADII